MKINFFNLFGAVVLLFIGILIGSNLGGYGWGRGLSFAKDDKLASVVKLVHDNYVDSVDVDSLEGETVNQFLQNLDPHSLYLPQQRAQTVNQTLNGGFNGVGVAYQLINDTLYITQVSPNSPAAKAGIMGGDRVVNLNDEKFAGTHLTIDNVHKLIGGAKNSEIKLGILRAKQSKLTNITVKRGHVELSSLDAAYMVAPEVGYVKVSKFAATTDRDFKAALTKLKTQGMTKLALDLRNNGGGYLNAATAMADEFLPAGKLIMYTKGVHEPRTDYMSTDSGSFKKGKLAILIDEYSASASEVLAGAMQDLDRATIVGRRSFGKGLVQEQFPFKDGSAVNLTVARYYTPSGRSVQKSYSGGIEVYHNELASRMQKGELFSAKNTLDDSVFKKPSKYHTLNGRKVYSGGGIMPDVFVPADTTSNTKLMYDLNNQQLYMAYVLQRMQPVLAKYTSYESFKTYSVSDDELSGFIIYATKTLKQLDSLEIKVSKAKMKRYIKATAAGFKWGDNAYYEALNEGDETLKKAIEAVM